MEGEWRVQRREPIFCGTAVETCSSVVKSLEEELEAQSGTIPTQKGAGSQDGESAGRAA